MKENHLFQKALEARELANARYSGFKVGAALETAEGRIYCGSNIESASYGLSICAERVALFKALSEGEKNFVRILVTADSEEVCRPCGACRQLLADYAPQIEVIMTNLKGEMEKEPLEALLKNYFKI